MQTQTRTYSPEEYLEREAAADYKSEYRDGAIVNAPGLICVMPWCLPGW